MKIRHRLEVESSHKGRIGDDLADLIAPVRRERLEHGFGQQAAREGNPSHAQHGESHDQPEPGPHGR